MNQKIYTVTTIGDEYRDAWKACVGWFETIELARQIVLNNTGDIYETIYDLAVIEEVQPGLYPTGMAEHWFRWSLEKKAYEPCDKPKQLESYFGFAFG